MKLSAGPPGVTLAVAASALFAFATAAQASIIPIGSSLTFGGTNLPGACTDTTCSDTTTFGLGTPVLIDGGALSLTTSQVADGPNAEWDVWSISTVSGGPVAGDINGDWAIVMDYDLAAPVNFDAVVTQWTVDGTPVSPLSNFAGICCATASNPSPISGEAYYNSGFAVPLPAGVQSNWREIFVDPYSFVSAGGIDPSTANDFAFALHFTLQTPVPEPGSLALLAGGLTGLVGWDLLRRRRQI
ncbi:MAG: PEP-CTERM sorting domain-containing protein [Acetobacteraceae bacterium]